jgi:F-type H+-transporting ATPase subunit gamma
MNEMLSHLAMASSTEIVHPYFEERDVKKKTLVVVASDRGLCGSFNANLLRKANNWLAENKDYEVELMTVGKRAHDFYKRRQNPIISNESDWSGVLSYDRARNIVSFLTDRFVNGETDLICLVYTKFISLVKYQIVVEQYLPVAKPEMNDDDQGGASEYIFEPSAEEIYSALMPSYATTKMVTALTESFASEHGSRMMAMGNATKNAGEMVDNLTLDYNKARQAQITKELLEVVGGAEALNA